MPSILKKPFVIFLLGLFLIVGLWAGQKIWSPEKMTNTSSEKNLPDQPTETSSLSNLQSDQLAKDEDEKEKNDTFALNQEKENSQDLEPEESSTSLSSDYTETSSQTEFRDEEAALPFETQTPFDSMGPGAYPEDMYFDDPYGGAPLFGEGPIGSPEYFPEEYPENFEDEYIGDYYDEGFYGGELADRDFREQWATSEENFDEEQATETRGAIITVVEEMAMEGEEEAWSEDADLNEIGTSASRTPSVDDGERREEGSEVVAVVPRPSTEGLVDINMLKGKLQQQLASLTSAMIISYAGDIAQEIAGLQKVVELLQESEELRTRPLMVIYLTHFNYDHRPFQELFINVNSSLDEIRSQLSNVDQNELGQTAETLAAELSETYGLEITYETDRLAYGLIGLYNLQSLAQENENLLEPFERIHLLPNGSGQVVNGVFELDRLSPVDRMQDQFIKSLVNREREAT